MTNEEMRTLTLDEVADRLVDADIDARFAEEYEREDDDFEAFKALCLRENER